MIKNRIFFGMNFGMNFGINDALFHGKFEFLDVLKSLNCKIMH